MNEKGVLSTDEILKNYGCCPIGPNNSVCKRCGALVWDIEVHEEFHANPWGWGRDSGEDEK